MEIKREWLEKLIFEGEVSRRFTQDSPILPDVWICFGEEYSRNREVRVDLLLTPHKDWTVGDLFVALRERLLAEREAASSGGRRPLDVAYNQSAVVARLSLPELLRVALPLTGWWQERVRRHPGLATARDLHTGEGRRAVAEATDRAAAGQTKERDPVDLLWLIALVGSILEAADAEEPAREEEKAKRWDEIVGNRERLAKRFQEFVMDPVEAVDARTGGAPRPVLFLVSENRRASPTVNYSVQAVKADAARLLFNVSCADLAWAILDSGIDATHPAFRARDGAGAPLRSPFPDDGGTARQTRVMATFDFTRIRNLLSVDPVTIDLEVARVDEALGRVDAELARLQAASEHAAANTEAVRRERARLERVRARLAEQRGRWMGLADDPNADREAKELRTGLLSGRVIDWDRLRPFFEVPHERELYVVPLHEHGTHVAGILAADWQRKEWPDEDELPEVDVRGVCPDIRLYDFRVFGSSGEGDEFSVMAALQFLRHLNSHRELPLIHGANLSLSIRHDVANYACGRTPVCDECERVVAAGIVVVAAAGNQGYNRFSTVTAAGRPATYEGYSGISITDPGNAESVITVGATHRIEPHTYGVSYFSSRGPTGDGRYKPDLVAPGEKILAPVPGKRARPKDGTSMAAPHVSGAAALILARYREFIGRPARVKQVLCSTATDLGRDRYFQGAGMVDVLRALQSV